MSYLLRLDESFAEELCLPAFLVGWELPRPLVLPMRGSSTGIIESVTPTWSFTPPQGWKPRAPTTVHERFTQRALWRTGWHPRTGELPDHLHGRATSLVELRHSVGGYACGMTTLLGVLLRLDAQPADASSRRALVELFQLMAQDPDFHAIAKRAPELRSLVGTSGTPYSTTELARLHRWVHRVFACPPFERGVEAAVCMKACNPLAVFAGCRALVATVADDQVSFTDGQSFDGKLLHQLVGLGAKLGLADPRCSLLWVNCD